MSRVMVLSDAAVRQQLPLADCLPLIDQALRDVALGKAAQPVRTRLAPPHIGGALGLMPGYLEPCAALGVKAVTVFEGNFSRGLASHRGALLLFDPQDGALQGVFDAGAITSIRTAAASAVATRALASPDAERLAILGYGEQALAHIDAMVLVRPIRQVRVWGRSTARALEFAKLVTDRHSIDAHPATTVASAVADAQIICTTTAAREPILGGDMVPAGCHVNLVGSSFPDAREVDSHLVARSRFFADDVPMVEALGGEWRAALADSSVGPQHLLGSIGEVLNGTLYGRLRATDLTVFKSVGLIAEDLAAAAHLYARGTRTTADPSVTWIDF